MAHTKKALLSKRAEMISLIGQHPGITSAEIAERLALESSNKVGTALWTAIRAGRVMTERVERNGRWMNKHYLPDQVPPDAVTRVKQRIVDASEVIPPPGALSAPTSVFNGPRKPKHTKRPTRKVTASPAAPSRPVPQPKVVEQLQSFSCAVANDGSLVLMRGGRIEMSLPEVDAAVLQSYLVKRAAASLFANMA
ncbi:hypothetical protein PQQ53_14160 [Paraburkholderia strydomiana]|uniref:hypothetical protein n=1 Tax=Paraburkholderia strydomiana TaxID=1245417 RepID=UPI0038BB7463